MRKITRIIVHCSASADFEPLPAADIRRFHVQERGWSDIGYHYVIQPSGETEAGRPLSEAGAHTYGHNADSIGICLIGGKGSKPDDFPQEHFTVEALYAAQTLIDSLRDVFEPFTGSKITVHGHNEFSNKACPGFNAQREFK